MFPGDFFTDLILKGNHAFWKAFLSPSLLWQYEREAVEKFISISYLNSDVQIPKGNQKSDEGENCIGNICSFSQLPHSLRLPHRCFIFFSTSICEKMNITKLHIFSLLWFKHWETVQSGIQKIKSNMDLDWNLINISVWFTMTKGLIT